jgi:hypothetical protein
MKAEILDKEILSILALQDEYPMTVELVTHYLNASLEADVLDIEVLGRLQFLKDRGWVDFRVDDYRAKKWFITDTGKIHRLK